MDKQEWKLKNRNIAIITYIFTFIIASRISGGILAVPYIKSNSEYLQNS